MSLGVYYGGRLVIPKAITPVYPLRVRRGCTCYLDMQDMGAKIIDHSGRHNHGINYGSTPTAGPSGLVRSFDGVDDRIVLPTSVLQGTDGTVLWFVNAVFSTQTANNIRMFTTGDTRGDAYMFRTYAKTPCSFYVGNGTTSTSVSMGNLPDNKWIFLAATWKYGGVNTALKCYQNAINTGNNSLSGTVALPNVNAALGYWYNGGYFSGKIGLVQIYSRALPADEIAEIYAEEAWRYGIAA